jgi:TolB-like protein/Flp pilus assembly protein TadD
LSACAWQGCRRDERDPEARSAPRCRLHGGSVQAEVVTRMEQQFLGRQQSVEDNQTGNCFSGWAGEKMKMPASSEILQFADFRFDRAGGGLFRRDDNGAFAPVTIGWRALDLLAALIDRRGDVVSKEEIMAAVWPKMAIEEANLFVQISSLRAILDKEQSGQSCIQTVAGRGYRFIAPVTRCAELRSTPAEALEPPHTDGPSKRGDPGPPRLSIVVLPFANFGGDASQDYFVDGVTESLTTDLSRISGAFVIDRRTAFSYRSKAFDHRQIGRELNVRYVLEGSVQRAGNRMRVNVQLIEAETSAHLWAERFDKPLADLFDMQDEIVARMANQLQVELIAVEARRLEKAPSPDSMDLYFQAKAILSRGATPDILARARVLCERALQMDCANVHALVEAALVDIRAGANFMSADRQCLIAAETKLSKATATAPELARAHYAMGWVLCMTKRAEGGDEELKQALAIDPNLAGAHAARGWAKIMIGRADETEAHVLEALRLSPRDASSYLWFHFVGQAKTYLGEFVQALPWLRKSIGANRNWPWGFLILAACLAHLGRFDEARRQAKAGLAVLPNLTLCRFRPAAQSDNPVHLAQRERLIEGLRLAGVPEE